MSSDVTELIELAVAIVAIAFVLFLLRRASVKSRLAAPTSARERLDLEPEAEVARPRRERKKPRPNQGTGGKKAKAEPAKPEKPDKKPERKPVREADVDDSDEDSEEAAPATDAAATAAYKAGLAKTRGGFVAKLGKIFGRKKIDAATLDELEETLFTADIGPRAADRIFQSVKGALSKAELEDEAKIWARIKKTSRDILTVEAPPLEAAMSAHKPFVLLVLGVNGVGKTTTIGKLASLWKAQGKKIILAAGDTFRAAATEQLEIWGERSGVPVVKGKAGGDPSSVIFDAIKRGVDEQFDIVICDTAGRLHSNVGLMDELKKVRRVCEKAMPGSPHQTWMVLDSTTGQNAISQAKTFKADMEISGIVLTKMDGSSKGGVVLGICDELKVPVRYIGVGEKIEDLKPFDPATFVEALYDQADVSN